MALIHWWPFNGDACDIASGGLLRINNATYSQGKVSVNSLKSTSSIITPLTIQEITPLSKDFTFACWVKINKSEVAAQISGLDKTYDRPTGSLIGFNNYGGVALTWFADSTSNFNKIYLIGTIRGSHSPNGTGGYELPFDTWTHAVLVNNSKARSLSLYINGELRGTQDTSIFTSIGNETSPIYINQPSIYASNGPKSILPCYLNDVRIYNHALTGTEINLLSQGMVAHYPLKAPFLPNLLQGAEQYTKENPLARKASDVTHKYDSYVYNYNIYTNIRRAGTYIFVLKSNGTPSWHDTGNSSGENTPENKKYSMWLYNTDKNTHSVWYNYQIAKDGTHYGLIDLNSGNHVLRTNLYLPVNDGQDYSVDFYDIQLFECNSYTPEFFEPAYVKKRNPKYFNSQYNIENSLTQDVSGFGNHAKMDGLLDISGNSPIYAASGYFDGQSYLACGKNAKVTDTITVTCWAYMDDWSNYAGKRVLSCTDGGGWNFEPSGDSTSGGIGFAIAIAKPSGGAQYQYFNTYSSKPISQLASGWHFFCGVYDGFKTVFYLDGDKSERTGLDTKTPIYYNNNNGLFIGAEAAGSATVPQAGTYFNGKISDIRIYGTALSEGTIKDIYERKFTKRDDATVFSSNIIENERDSYEDNGSITSGNFTEKDICLSNMKIKALPDGSAWARIYNLNLTEQNKCFSNEEVNNCDVFGKYSKMGMIDQFGKELPGGYTRLEYIQSTGAEVINTGVIPDQNTSIEVDFEFLGSNAEPNVVCLFGARTSTTNNVFAMWLNTTNIYPHYGNVDYQANSVFSINTKQRMVYKYNKNIAKVGNTSISCTQANFTNTSIPICLFAMNTNSTIDNRKAIGRLYGCKIFNENTLVRHFIPCKDSNNNYGLYDLIDKVFYQNSGTGQFQPGKEKEKLCEYELMLTYPSLKTQLPIGYTQLEYIEANGRQWINTGVSSMARWEFTIQFTPIQGRRQLMGYHGNHQEYWGINGNNYEAGGQILSSTAGNVETIIHNFGEDGYYNLQIKDEKKKVNNATGPNPAYQLFSILSLEDYACYARLYSCNCVQNNKLIRQFIPARENSTNKVGLYDLANNTFYSSASGYNFIAGPVIENYQLLEYIQSNGTQYIDTGVGYNLNSKQELNIKYSFNDVGEYDQIMGYTGNRGMGIGIDPSKVWWETNTNTHLASVQPNVIYQAYWKKHNSNYERRINDTVLSTGNDGNGKQENNGNMLLFAAHQSNGTAQSGQTIDYFCKVKLYEAKIYVNDILVRDYAPAINSSGQVGLLDLINYKFYSSQEDNFTAGPNKNPTYEALEYLESTGTQYINTEFTVQSTTSNNRFLIEAEVASTNPTLGRNFIFGFDNPNHSHYSEFNEQGQFGSYQAYTQDTYNDNTIYQVRMEIHGGDGGLVSHTINGKTVYVTNNDWKKNNWGTFNLFCLNSSYMGNTIRIYKAKIYSDGRLVRDFIPARRVESDQYGMYDKANGRFYYNAGSGEFLAKHLEQEKKVSPIEQYNRWVQISSPNSNYQQVLKYQPIHTDLVRWDGYKYDTGPITKSFNQEDSIYLINNSNDRWAPIGQKILYGDGTRAANGTTQQNTELWVRFDTLPDSTQEKKEVDSISAANFIEY